MKISVIAPHELDAASCRRWLALQDAHPALGSPCYSVEFTQAAGHARQDVRIAVLEDEGETVGFFPFQTRWGAGQPVAGRFCDHQGVVAAAGTQWDWGELLRACRLGYWQFDHLPTWQRPPVEVVHARSPGLDLSGGFEAYRQRRAASGSKRLDKLERAARKMARDLGPLRLELHSRDPELFETVLRLKSEQCVRTGASDCFADPWAREFVTRIAATDNPDFGGRLSALYAGDTLVAAHFGMRSRRVYQWWFPVYNREHGAYSPGSILLMQVAEAAAAQGHQLLDLGKGDEAYKEVFADSSVPLVEGIVSRPAAATWLRRLRKSTGAWLRTSPLAQPVRPLLHHFGRLGGALVACPELMTLAADLG
ncbi:MAG TPA: GNAT family N-acetyltransferase [Ramlibacter sp.]|nr:GNAT family N-acetyltransferase [Ramlibacter sp.]